MRLLSLLLFKFWFLFTNYFLNYLYNKNTFNLLTSDNWGRICSIFILPECSYILSNILLFLANWIRLFIFFSSSTEKLSARASIENETGFSAGFSVVTSDDFSIKEPVIFESSEDLFLTNNFLSLFFSTFDCKLCSWFFNLFISSVFSKPCLFSFKLFMINAFCSLLLSSFESKILNLLISSTYNVY